MDSVVFDFSVAKKSVEKRGKVVNQITFLRFKTRGIIFGVIDQLASVNVSVCVCMCVLVRVYQQFQGGNFYFLQLLLRVVERTE